DAEIDSANFPVPADEPTGNLDQGTGRGVIDLLFRLQRQRGMTLLLITHDPALAARCDRQLFMADGRLEEAEIARDGKLRRLKAGGAA
ncbi:MAG TPA: hypothetical protein VFG47_10650, partial [Geminicoccaceae bacterium]|nr:hypothetical protein [Geminicoccaceae bacterium]